MLISYKNRIPRIAPSAFIEKSAQVIGDVEIGDESSIWFNVILRGDINTIHIGHRSNIQDASVIHVGRAKLCTVIGNDVTIGHRAVVHGCTIGDRSLVGIGAILLDGVVVGEESMVAAGTVVAPGTVIPPRTLTMGTPGRVRRSLTDTEIRFLRQSAANYVILRLDYMRPVDPKPSFNQGYCFHPPDIE